MPSPKKYSKEEAEKEKKIFLRLSRRDRFADMRCKVFGQLKVIWYAGKHKGHLYWFCVCDCGTYIKVATNNLRSGKTKSCGCAPRKKYEKRFGAPTKGYKKDTPPPFQTIKQYYKNESGFNSNLSAFLYIQSVSGNGQRFIKYGVTNDWPEVRAKTTMLSSLYKHAVLNWWCFEDGKAALKIETKLKQKITPYAVKNKFPGHTETARPSLAGLISELVEMLSKDSGCLVIKKDDYTGV